MRYGEVASVVTQMMDVSGNDSNITLLNLSPSTEYSLSVAAMNGALTGPFSPPVYQLTAGERIPLQYSIISFYLSTSS